MLGKISSKRYRPLGDVKPVVPIFLWRIAQFISVSCFFGLCLLLITDSEWGLFLFWGVLIPVAPMIFFFCLGLWRNICPLAAMHQSSRLFGFTRAFNPPAWFREYGFVISTILILSIIPARKYLFNQHGPSLALLLVSIIGVAFVMGYLFKGKSGWCTSICPILPFERIYGQIPFARFRNSYCEPCIGCTENCYDYSPYTSMTALINGTDKHRSGYRKVFVAALPGFVYAFYTVPAPPEVTIFEMYQSFFVYMAVSIAIFYVLINYLKVQESHIAMLFGMLGFNCYYYFTIPLTIEQYQIHLDVIPPEQLQYYLYGAVIVLSLFWIVRAVRNERAFMKTAQFQGQRPISLKVVDDQHDPSDLVSISIQPDNKTIQVPYNSLLLTVLQENDIAIEAGCRMGMCGSDGITILEGQENINPPTNSEQDTLKRLGLSNKSRMACSVRVKGDIVISLAKDEGKGDKGAQEIRIHPRVNKNIKKILIVGNGIAGMTAAETVHQLNPTCEINVIAREGYLLYNRMAIASLIYGHQSVETLALLPENKRERTGIEIWYNTRVVNINKHENTVTLGSGERLHYDRLILATGSRCFIPKVENFDTPGCFALREADDAMAIRAYIQDQGCKKAVVVGGGLSGLEAAYALKQVNLEVTVLEYGQRLLSRQLDIVGSSFLQKYLESLGIRVLTNADLATIKKNKQVVGISLKDGRELDADLMLVCAGIVPNVELAEMAHLEVKRGIVVDEFLQTSDESIFAIGDAAEFTGRVEGLWMSAINQGKLAAGNALGVKEAYPGTIAHTILKVAGINLASIGVTEPTSNSDTVISLMDLEQFHYRKLVLSNNIIIGAILIGYPEESVLVANVIKEKVSVESILPDLLQGDWKSLESCL